MPPEDDTPPPRTPHGDGLVELPAIPTSVASTPVVLVPDVRVAMGWSLVALAAVAVSTWLVVEAGATGTGALLLVPSAVVAATLLRQVVAPTASAVVIDDRGVRGRSFLRRQVVPTLRGAELGTWLGEPVLRVRDLAGVRRTFLLPVGSDVTGVTALLARRAGDQGRTTWSAADA